MLGRRAGTAIRRIPLRSAYHRCLLPAVLSGKTAICSADLAGRIVASNFLLRLRVDETAAVPRFVWYVLNTSVMDRYIPLVGNRLVDWTYHLLHIRRGR